MNKSLICKIILVIVFALGILFGKIINLVGINAWLIQYSGIVDATQIVLVILTLLSLLMIVLQIKSEHEKSRREKAVDLLLQWTQTITKEMNSVKKIVEKFDGEQCRKLFIEEEFEVNCNIYDDIMEAINEKSDKKEKNDKCAECDGDDADCRKKISLGKKHIRKLRWNTISYLNLLESILVAWQYSIVDREIIEHQFSFQVSPKDGKRVLDNFRKIAGAEDSYPAIEIFCSNLEQQRKMKLKEKGKIV